MLTLVMLLPVVLTSLACLNSGKSNFEWCENNSENQTPEQRENTEKSEIEDTEEFTIHHLIKWLAQNAKLLALPFGDNVLAHLLRKVPTPPPESA